MKNKILLSLAIISCLAFTACGTNETVADSTSASENIVSENSVSESTVSESSVSESTVAESDTIEPESSQQGTITGYESPEDAVVDENTNPNDIGHEYAPTEEEEVVEEETAETAEDETQTEENQSSFQWPDEETREWFGTEFGLSEDELNNMTQQRFDSLLQSWLNGDIGGSNSTGGNSGGSSSNESDAGSDDDIPWGEVPQLNPGTVGGNM